MPRPPRPPAPPRAPLPREVVVLGWVSFFNDVSSEMIYPLLPAFLTGTLHAAPACVGLVEGVAEASASLAKIVSGRLADRFGRAKPLVLWGYGISSLVRPAIALATSAAALGGVMTSRRPRMKSAGHSTFAAASMPPA